MKHFDDANVKLIRKEVEEALQKIAQRHGLKVSTLGNIGYNPSTMHTGKLSFAIEAKQIRVTETNLEDLIGKRFKQGSRTFNIRAIEDGKLLAVTNRGARYLIRKEQLNEMIQL